MNLFSRTKMDNVEYSNIWNGTTPSRPNWNAKFRSATGYLLAKILQLILILICLPAVMVLALGHKGINKG